MLSCPRSFSLILNDYSVQAEPLGRAGTTITKSNGFGNKPICHREGLMGPEASPFPFQSVPKCGIFRPYQLRYFWPTCSNGERGTLPPTFNETKGRCPPALIPARYPSLRGIAPTRPSLLCSSTLRTTAFSRFSSVHLASSANANEGADRSRSLLRRGHWQAEVHLQAPLHLGEVRVQHGVQSGVAIAVVQDAVLP